MRERLHAYTKRTLGAGGSYNDAVALPQGESCAAWVAVHAIDFYNDVSTIWAVMSSDPYLNSFRPGEGFPSGVEYRWSDGPGEALSVSAPVYIEKVLGWIADQINDDSKFPDDDDETEALRVFQTPQFAALCGQIFRRLFRVYGIIYSSFFGTLEALDMAPHLNSCFKRKFEDSQRPRNAPILAMSYSSYFALQNFDLNRLSFFLLRVWSAPG